MKNCCLCGLFINSSDGEVSGSHCSKCDVHYCERCALLTAACSICGSAVGILENDE